ncbi:MAG: hypothetical protein ACP5IJ_01450 [Candidatus Nanoarchaeia archaeon]
MLANYLEKIKKFELILVMFALFVIFLTWFSTNITSYHIFETSLQRINLTFENSAELILSSDEPESLTFLALSGNVVGQGNVKIYLTNGEAKLLVWDNSQRNSNIMTGYATYSKNQISNSKKLKVSIGRPLEYFSSNQNNFGIFGKFSNVCIETCTLDPKVWKGKEWRLLIYLSPNTKLELDELIFTMI